MSFKRYPKRNAVKNYFPLPNEIFCLGLSAGEIAVYAYLMYCEDRKTFQCHPNYRTIGRAVGLSRNTVKKYVTGLEQKHLITTVPTTVCTKNGRKRNGSLLYTIRPIEEAKEYYFEQQLQCAEEESLQHKTRELFEQHKREQTRKVVKGMRMKLYKMKRIHNESKKRCTMCGKNFDLWDEQENFCLDRRIGYGSSYDGCQVKFQLCCGCFDRVLDMVIPLCRTTPITDLMDWEWPDEEKTTDIMESRLK